jgi:rod shape-determining protein MreC
LQALLAFKEQFISQTLAAQVIGSSGSAQSRSIYIDKGTRDGIKTDMAVITADGVVGKVLRVFHSTSLVLLIDDQSSGVGALLEKSRLQGVVRGTPAGEVLLEKVTSDQQVQAGEAVLTSGGDRIFPKGLAVGTVTKISQGSDLFLNIGVRPAANLNKLEEVLVVTKLEEKDVLPTQTGPVRAADILAQRLPSVPDKPATDNAGKIDKNTPSKPSGIAAGTQIKSQFGVAPVARSADVSPANPKAAGSSPQGAAVAGTPGVSNGRAVKPSVKPGEGSFAAAPQNKSEKFPATSSPGGAPPDAAVQGQSASEVSGAASPSPSANAAPATVKPATARKPAAPVINVSDKGAKPVVPAKSKPDQSNPNSPEPGQATPDQTRPNQAKPEPTQPAQPKPDQPAVDGARPDQSPPQRRPR